MPEYQGSTREVSPYWGWQVPWSTVYSGSIPEPWNPETTCSSWALTPEGSAWQKLQRPFTFTGWVTWGWGSRTDIQSCLHPWAAARLHIAYLTSLHVCSLHYKTWRQCFPTHKGFGVNTYKTYLDTHLKQIHMDTHECSFIFSPL